MQFTYLLAEMVVIGATSLYVVLSLLAEVAGLAFLRPDIIAPRLDLAVFGVLLSYPFGLVWSRLSDIALSTFDKKLVAERFESASDYHASLAKALMADTEFAKGLSGYRANYRVCRAMAFTIGLAAASVACGRGIGSGVSATPAARAVLSIALTLFALGAFHSWFHLRASYLEFVAHSSSKQ